MILDSINIFNKCFIRKLNAAVSEITITIIYIVLLIFKCHNLTILTIILKNIQNCVLTV